MEYGFLSRAGKFLQEQTKRRRWTMIFLCMAAGVTLGTLGFLKLYGQAMTHKVKMLDCQYAVHEHTEDCYEENEDGEEVLICGLADYVIHVHNDDCYDQKGDLVCQLEEHELHEHEDSCWEEEEVLICDEEESEDGKEAGTGEETGAAAQTTDESQTADNSQNAEAGSGSDAEITKELACEKEEHTHSDSCYADGAGCEKEAHTHGDGCYETTEELVCEASEHTHDDSCYTVGESELTCGESEHEHDDSCYDEEDNEVCGESEHTHNDSCYSEGESELTCGTEEHTHGDGCYEVTETLTCEIEEHEHDDSCAAESELICEIEEHEHDDSCYVETKAETEQKEESESAEEPKAEEETKTEETVENGEEAEEGHTHTDDCYETQEVLTCGELELHTHDADPESETCCYTEDCFDEEGNLIEGSRPSCGLLQLEEHIHTEECFKIVELTPEEIAAINGGATLHVHTEECYDEEGNLICGHEVTHLHQLECYDEDGNLICGFGGEEKPKHEHDANCYDEEGNLICGNEDAENHEHDAECYDEEGNLICDYEGVRDHEHDAGCYDEEGNLICGYEGVKDHEHDAECYDILGELICGYEGVKDHVHTEECYDENGNLICGREVLEVYSQSKRFECDDYIVVARYNEDAEISEEAELLVEQITPESDGEHYANRETEYRQILEDETASMRALLKIGFYVEDENGQTEVEPKTPVAVAIQFLDEDGLAEGKPITVIHFAEEGTEKLDGSHAKDNSTTFKIDSFSEIAIGYGPEGEVKVNKNGTLHISNDFEVDADPFRMVFHVEGDAKSVDGAPIVVALPETEPADSEGAGTEEAGEGDALPEEGPAEGESALPEMEEAGEAVQPDADVAPEGDAGTEGDAAVNPEGAVTPEGDAVADENVPAPQLNFHVKSLDDDAELQEALMNYLGESTDEVNRNILHTISYRMTYGDVELDLSDCVVKAEITLTAAVSAPKGAASEGETLAEKEDSTEPEAADDGAAGDADTPEAVDGEPTDSEDAPKTSDEGLTEGAETADTTSGDLVSADNGQGNTEVVNVTSKNTAVVNEITENKEEIENFKELLADEDEETEISVMAIGVSSAGQMNKLATMAVGEEQQMAVNWNGGIMALANEARIEQIFTVQYYTYLPIAAREATVPTGATGIPIIDTSAEKNGGKAKLPKNGTDPVLTNLIVAAKEDGSAGPISAFHEVKAENSLKKIYKDAQFDFAYYPKLENFNKFADEYKHYDLKEVWVLKEGKNPASENAADWDVYKNPQQLEFTNDSQYVKDHPGTAALVKQGTVIRLVSESNTGGANYNAVFYDYDITNGKVYSDSGLITPGDRNSTEALYANTNRQGINAEENYETPGQAPNYGFGNFNVGGTGLNNDRYQEYFINRSTQHEDSGEKKAYEGCSFGIVKSQLDSEGLPVFNMDAPKIFGPESQTGKTIVPGYSLDFKREGDTYTLTSVNDGTDATKNLDSFQYRENWNKTRKLWTNNFWPMDTSKNTYGTDGHDLKFGNKDKVNLRKAVGTDSKPTFPEGDDGKDHNSYFGMQFAVEFTLTEDYLGPLNYYFFGDDDMWVFLDGKLICDIGGVHSSSGAYVDLWDYIAQGDASKHELRFFYTERGASGSTCWMQFTLPSVNTVPIDYPVGSIKNTLTVNKKVTGADTDQKFEFGIDFYDKDGGKELINYYAYTIVNGNEEIEAGNIKTGGSFFLGNGDSIIIQNLPDGAKYVVKEKVYSGYESEINGTVEKDRTTEGNIDWTKDDVESYINKSLPYNLPETGGPGPIWYMIAGAFFILLGTGLMYNKKFSERRV